MSQLAEQKLKFGKSILPLQNELAERSAQLRTLSTGEKVSLSDINQTIDEIGNLTVSSGSPECIQSAFLEAFRCFNFVDIHGYFFENS